MTDLPTLTSELRTLAHDTPTSNLVNQETPNGTNDGSNKNFRLQNQNVVSGSVYFTVGSTFRGQTGYSVDYPNGIISFTNAPPASSNPFEVDYAFQWFPDADYTVFLTEAVRTIGPGDVKDPTQTTDGLLGALYQVALYYFWMRRASSYAHKFSSSGGQAGQSVDVVSKAFKGLADSAMKTGLQLRDDYYKRQGQREMPASAVVQYPIDPYSPRK